jgi:hypothetical protein
MEPSFEIEWEKINRVLCSSLTLTLALFRWLLCVFFPFQMYSLFAQHNLQEEEERSRSSMNRRNP